MTRRLSGALIVAAVSALAIPAQAQELKIAIAAEPTSIDPLYHTLNPNNQVARHIFDRLVHQDTQQRLVPGLALSLMLTRRAVTLEETTHAAILSAQSTFRLSVR